MKKALFILAVLAIVAAAGIFFRKKGHATEAKPAEEKPPAEESRLSHDDKGRVVVKMSDEVQGNVGLLVAKPPAAQLTPELKGYGRVLDPAALAALITELASARAAYSASSNEQARLTTLVTQGNASERALQAAQAGALHDQLSIQSVKDRLTLSWGQSLAERTDLPELIQQLASQSAALVRIDLPAGETLRSAPAGARISTLSGALAEAEFLSRASNVDPQMLSQGFLFLVKPNTLHLLPGEALTGYLKVTGEPLSGVTVPRDAVVRTEGSGWIYTLNPGGDSFTRIEVPLDRPEGAGWFVSTNVTTNDYVVVTGAQILLSEELKGSLKAD